MFSRFLLIVICMVTSLSAANAQETKMLYMQQEYLDNTVADMEKGSVGIKIDTGETLYFNIELAASADEQAKGMMYRTEMGDYDGMLFVFPDESMRTFWMKNTLIPLDMLFLDHAGRIHHIHHSALPQDLSYISSKYPSKAVLEIKGGTAAKLGIKVGDHVIHDTFMNEDVQQ